MVEFNRSQRLGLDIDKHIAIDAGAGTGKTTVMAERYVQHLFATNQRSTIILPNGPRVPIEGHGSLRAPARERTDAEEWPGLLPSEVVAITFTRKAAAELRHRIRKRLSKSRKYQSGGEDTIFEPRIRRSGDVDMLLTYLDDAPISTIDAFLGQLVSPYLDILSNQPTRAQISESRAPLLVKETINSAWRIRNVVDADEAGIRGHKKLFIEARNRLAVLLGGQEKAEIVLTGLLNTSLFVDETKRAMKKRSKLAGIEWNLTSLLDEEILREMISEPAYSMIDSFADELHKHLNDWIDEFMAHYSGFVGDCEIDQGTSMTRFNQLVDLARNNYPNDKDGKLQWVWLVALCSTTYKSLIEGGANHFPKGCLPQVNHSDGWMPGLFSKSNATVRPIKTRNQVAENAAEIANKMRTLLSSNTGLLVKLIGRSSYIYDPIIELNSMPEDFKHRYQQVGTEISELAPQGNLRISKDLQLNVLKDLLIVHNGLQQILGLRKSQEGAHDYDDIQKLTADLLLAKCPETVRYDYPPEVVDALDDISEESWTDSHIIRALELAKDKQKCYEDLVKRYTILQTLRRQYRAFIIDEYQDTNPAHFRLLSRLWGRRHKESGDPKEPRGFWDPTICIVGDMKQSIYRFRQAEVTVMRRTVEWIKQCNLIEQSEERLDFLRTPEHGRDPRPSGSGGEQLAFSNKHDKSAKETVSKPWEAVPFGFGDISLANGKYETLAPDHKRRRELGHIDLTSNHRTSHDVLLTLNGIFTDVFDDRHHKLPGDWHAKEQPLNPAKKNAKHGKMEWLLPLQIEADKIDKNNIFADPKSKSIHLENEMIAMRLQNLLASKPCNIWDAKKQEFVLTENPSVEYLPSDITILVHSRKHIPDLIARLEARGIPVISDRQGQLLKRPVIKPLMAALNLIAHPTSKLAAVSLAKSSIIGLNDDKIHEIFYSLKEHENWWEVLQKNTSNKAVSNLLVHIQNLMLGNKVHEILNVLIDNSDLLMAYPDDSSRQNAELWCQLVYDVGEECGHNPSEIYSRLESLVELENKGPQAITVPSSGAVKIMTIHGAKGLQSPVVVVAGLFHAGKSDSSLAARDNVLVTPEIVAGRINPWSSRDRPDDGLWEFAKSIDSAQRQAERRREFYVALTRVENHLILVGNSRVKGEISSIGEIEFTSKPSDRTLGAMLLDGFRGLAHRNNIANSVWLLENDEFSKPLADYQENVMSIDPYQLYFNSQLGGDSIKSLAIYHSPNCFDKQSTLDANSNFTNIVNHLSNQTPKLSTTESCNQLSHSLKINASMLDSSVKCREHHWPNNLEKWNTAKLANLIIPDSTIGSVQSKYPTPIEFGLLMHRLIEIGLDNPTRKNPQQSIPLPKSWLIKPDKEMTDQSTIEIVLGEFGLLEPEDEIAKEKLQLTSNRMNQIASVISNGLIGKYANGETHHGRIPEGLRTELPFLYNHRVNLEGVSKQVFKNNSFQNLSNIDMIEVVFEGRADLVMAFRDDEGNGMLQVIDMKTTDCLHGFNHSNPAQGNNLQKINGDVLDRFATTEHEKSILESYKYQLTLYSMVLEAMELEKPTGEQRQVLPPAILIAASGKSIEMTVEDYELCKTQLIDQLDWIARLAAEPYSPTDPSRMSLSHAMNCWKGKVE